MKRWDIEMSAYPIAKAGASALEDLMKRKKERGANECNETKRRTIVLAVGQHFSCYIST